MARPQRTHDDPLVNDLSLLRTLGWSDPSRLARELTLMADPVVAQAVGGSLDTDRRATALRKLLLQLANRIEAWEKRHQPLNQRSDAFAARVLLRLMPDYEPLKVFELQDLIAKEWSVPAESFRRNFQTKFYERLARRFRDMRDEKLGPGASNDLQLRSSMAGLLKQYYGSERNLGSLADLVLGGRSVFDDAEVSLRLSDIADQPGRYQLDLNTRGLLHGDAYYLALTARATLSSRVIANCPEISEVFACSSAADARERAHDFCSRPDTVVVITPSRQGLAQRSHVALKPVSRQVKARLLGPLESVERSDVTVLEGRLPAVDQSHRVELNIRSEMDLGEHFCFWLCDRPTFVRRMVIDASAFTPSIKLRPCLGTAAYEARRESDRFVVDLDSWLVRGQGVVVVW